MHWGTLKARILAHGSVRLTGTYRFHPEQSTAGPGAGGRGSIFFATSQGRIRLALDDYSLLTLTADADGSARLTGPDIDICGHIEEAVYHCPRQHSSPSRRGGASSPAATVRCPLFQNISRREMRSAQ
ncbi:hypothetical protein [Methanogenium cariaci]|uniref:hypothetical protein n=1 Tax=Methanogenium cariaci TaxID=2197 RepID=UPI001FE242A9|nr:hypothetical protein [Methanogenium cariaci]